jgi:hypothetical protein
MLMKIKEKAVAREGGKSGKWHGYPARVRSWPEWSCQNHWAFALRDRLDPLSGLGKALVYVLLSPLHFSGGVVIPRLLR